LSIPKLQVIPRRGAEPAEYFNLYLYYGGPHPPVVRFCFEGNSSALSAPLRGHNPVGKNSTQTSTIKKQKAANNKLFAAFRS